MNSDSKIFKEWEKKDFVKTILAFFFHAIIIGVIITAAVALNTGSVEAFVNYFNAPEARMNFIYMMIAEIFLLTMVYLYFFCEFRNTLKEIGNIMLIFVVLELSLIICFVVGKYLHVFARPVALCALLILLLVNRRAAILMNFVSCLLMFMIDIFASTTPVGQSVYSSLVIGVSTGLFAVYLISNGSSRVKVVGMGCIFSIPLAICTLLLNNESANRFDASFVYGITSGMSSVVLMMAFLPIFEAVFNVVTDYRLAEITDHKSKLIKKLIAEAPGTFNHSLVVSTLAESCAIAIGENPLLARAAAYYHDIGKLKDPGYFTENQNGYNPHDELSPELSTDIIKSHARDGYELIKKYHLPMILADVAREHHGTLPIQYFYAKAKQFTEGELDIQKFSYDGPKPQSKLSAIIMICDGCEAAVRAIGTRSQEAVDKVTKSIIDDRMQRGQFDECPVTMKDIEIIRKTISQSLGGVYHDRIKYPSMNDSKKAVKEVAVKEKKEKKEKKETKEKKD